MPSTLTDRPLLALCRSQQFTVLELLHRLIELGDAPGQADARRQIVQQLRHRLSRHVQLMRHGFFPPLRQQAEGDDVLALRIKQFEDSLSDLVPQATAFLHEAERNPKQPCQAGARELYSQLKQQFELQQRQLHVLFMRHVPEALEQKQLKIFRRRLQATVSRDTAGGVASPPEPIVHTPPPVPNWDELDREAITRPVRPGETFHDLGQSSSFPRASMQVAATR